MGKAARIRAEQRRTDLAEMLMVESERWGRPETDLERAWLKELLQLPRVQVMRPPDEQLLVSGMRPKECHLNCWAQEKNDPQSKHYPGWMVDGPVLVLHSVIQAQGQWLCLTPQMAVGMPSTFEFIPDPSMEWVSNGEGGRVLRRRGHEVPVGLRAHPEVHVAMHQEFMRLIATGQHPVDAYKEIDDTFGKQLMELSLPS